MRAALSKAQALVADAEQQRVGLSFSALVGSLSASNCQFLKAVDFDESRRAKEAVEMELERLRVDAVRSETAKEGVI